MKELAQLKGKSLTDKNFNDFLDAASYMINYLEEKSPTGKKIPPVKSFLKTNPIYPGVDYRTILPSIWDNPKLKESNQYIFVEEDRYDIVVEALGVKPDDITIELNSNYLSVQGKTHTFKDKEYSVNAFIFLRPEIVSNITSEIHYRCEDGLIYISFTFKQPSANMVAIKRIS